MKLREGVKHVFSFLLESVFPSFCVSCGSEGSIVCDTCLLTLETSGVFCCPACHMINLSGERCMACVCLTPLSRHVAMMPLTETALIHKLIHLYKYQYIETLESTFSILIQRFFATYQFPMTDYVVPVPLHPKRYVERGFNQSERIAHLISSTTRIPFLNPLIRKVNTIKQATLDKKGREENVDGAFMVSPKYLECVVGKRIVLIDDVYTTGSTLAECAKPLVQASVREVSGWSIARG